MDASYVNIQKENLLTRGQENFLSFVFVLFLYLSFVGLLPFGPRLPEYIDQSGEQGDAFEQIFLLTIAVLASSIVLIRNDWRFINLIGIAIIASIGWTLLSVLWSHYPIITFRRAVHNAIPLGVVYILTALLGPRKILTILFYTLSVMIVASLISGLVIPNALHQPWMKDSKDLVGLWRGVFAHKNTAGAASAFLLLISIQQILYSNLIANKIHLWLAVICSCSLLFLSYSKTSILLIAPSLFFSAIFYYFIIHQNILYRTLVLIGTILSIFIAVFYFYYSDALSILDDPNAITGRAALWVTMFKMISDSPLLGYGYGAIFGVGEETLVKNYTTTEWVIGAYTAHSGYIQVTAEQGGIGLLLAAIAFIFLPFCRVVFSLNIPKEILPMLLAIMVFFIFNNMTETSLMEKKISPWIIYLIAISCIQYYWKIDMFINRESRFDPSPSQEIR